MRQFLHNLRNKPADTRHAIALGTSGAVTGIIFLVWVTVVTQGGLIDTANNKPSQTQTASPITALKQNASTAFQTISRQFSGSRSTTTVATSTQQFTSDIAPQGRSEDQSDPNKDALPPTKSTSYWHDKPSQQPTTKSGSAAQTPSLDSANTGSFWNDQ